MPGTLTIVGYEQGDFCAHCGRKLVHCVNTAELGLIGADCFNRLIVANPKRFSGNGKPGAALVRDLARLRDRYDWPALHRLGRDPRHFVFEAA